MAVQTYDIPDPVHGFEVGYWRPVNRPALTASGYAAWVIRRVAHGLTHQLSAIAGMVFKPGGPRCVIAFSMTEHDA